MRNAKEWFEQRRAADPELDAAYQAMGPRFDAIQKLIDARKEAGMTQTQLAKKMGVRQVVVSRIESGQNNTQIDTLARAAQALGRELVIGFRPITTKSSAGKR